MVRQTYNGLRAEHFNSFLDDLRKDHLKNNPDEFIMKDQTILFLAISSDPNCSLMRGDYKFQKPIELTNYKKCEGYTVRNGDRKIEIQTPLLY